MNSTSTTTSVVEPAKGSVPRIVPLVVDVPAMREWADELVERARHPRSRFDRRQRAADGTGSSRCCRPGWRSS